MANKYTIKHYGIIHTVSEDTMEVMLTENTGCEACQIASHCSIPSSKSRMITVDKSDTSYRPGDRVVVTTASSTAFRALLWGFGMPLVVLVVCVFIAYAQTHEEPLSALLGLAGLVPYYVVLYLMRDRLQKIISFRVEPIA